MEQYCLAPEVAVHRKKYRSDLRRPADPKCLWTGSDSVNERADKTDHHGEKRAFQIAAKMENPNVFALFDVPSIATSRITNA
jgi:hypothetical protein